VNGYGYSIDVIPADLGADIHDLTAIPAKRPDTIEERSAVGENVLAVFAVALVDAP